MIDMGNDMKTVKGLKTVFYLDLMQNRCYEKQGTFGGDNSDSDSGVQICAA
jgi:hypothetical protein